MNHRFIVLMVSIVFVASANAEDAPFPAFKEHVINADAGTGLAITVADINNDGKPDIVGASSKDVYWYENPEWTPHLIADTLKNSNVCVVPQDLNGDGIPELALGADWQFNNTASGGALFLLHADDDVTKPWNVVTLLDEQPTLHRIRWADVDGDEAMELIVAPLKGIGSTPPKFDDKPAKLFLLRPDADDPFKAPWAEEVIDETLHVLHNVWPAPGRRDVEYGSVLAASYEGVMQFVRDNDGNWTKKPLVDGNPEPVPLSGAGEIKTSYLLEREGGLGEGSSVHERLLATIEPWHGTQAVVYEWGPDKSWTRHVFDDGLRGGHAVWWADFDSDGHDELLVGFRDNAPPADKPGLQIYDIQREDVMNAGIAGWTKHVIDDGGMATEDAMAADMNGDGWPDVVAFGRATHNIKYYENLGLESNE